MSREDRKGQKPTRSREPATDEVQRACNRRQSRREATKPVSQSPESRGQREKRSQSSGALRAERVEGFGRRDLGGSRVAAEIENGEQEKTEK